MDVICVLGVFILSLLINFLPVIIAYARKNKNKVEVLLLNGIPYGVSVIFVFVEAPVISSFVAFLNIVLWVAALIKAIKGK